MSSSMVKALLAIFFTGMISGMFSGMSVKTKQPSDVESIMIEILKLTCEQLKEATTEEWYDTCRFIYITYSMILILTGILEIIKTASLVGNIRLGIIIYFLGWLTGLVYVIISI